MEKNNQKDINLDTEGLQIQKLEAHNALLRYGMFSVVMFFAGLTSAYIVHKGFFGDKWDEIMLPPMFYYSTVIILISSVFGFLAIRYCKNDNFQMLSRCLMLIIFFGLLFSVFQYFGFESLWENDKRLTGDNLSSSYIHILVFAHFLHLLGGLVSLLVVFFKSLNKQYSSVNLNGLRLSIRFWHFLALLWLYLFFFLEVIN